METRIIHNPGSVAVEVKFPVKNPSLAVEKEIAAKMHRFVASVYDLSVEHPYGWAVSVETTRTGGKITVEFVSTLLQERTDAYNVLMGAVQ